MSTKNVIIQIFHPFEKDPKIMSLEINENDYPDDFKFWVIQKFGVPEQCISMILNNKRIDSFFNYNKVMNIKESPEYFLKNKDGKEEKDHDEWDLCYTQGQKKYISDLQIKDKDNIFVFFHVQYLTRMIELTQYIENIVSDQEVLKNIKDVQKRDKRVVCPFDFKITDLCARCVVPFSKDFPVKTFDSCNHQLFCCLCHKIIKDCPICFTFNLVIDQ